MMQQMTICDQERESIVSTPPSSETNGITFVQDPGQNLMSSRRPIPDVDLWQPR